MCGTVSSKSCDGDRFNFFEIGKANNIYGCSGSGLNGTTALKGLININGKCQSTCHLHYSFNIFEPEISDNCTPAVTPPKSVSAPVVLTKLEN